LFPPPKKIKTKSGYLKLKREIWIQLPSNASFQLKKALSSLFEKTENRIINLTLAPGKLLAGNRQQDNSTLVRIEAANGKMTPQASHIEINPQRILIRGGSEQGIWLACLTLYQIINSRVSQYPCQIIEDAPDFIERGVMLDVSRCKVLKLESLFNLIDKLARLKYNQIQLYTEHSFQFANHPLVWKEASPYTASDMIKIRAFCRERFIDLVPNLNSFGHMERWLRHPEYHQYAECPDGFVHPLSGEKMRYGSTLKPNLKSLNLLESLYDEYLPLFDSPYFNIGGDEPWELGEGWSRSLCQEKGKSRVYLQFIENIQKLVEDRGRRMQFWGDIIMTDKSSLKSVSPHTCALNWGYEADHPFDEECASLANAGIPFYVVPGTSSWNSLTGRSLNAALNLENAARNGIRHGARGYLVTDWGDRGHHQYQGISYPGYFLGACHAWNHEATRQLASNPQRKLGKVLEKGLSEFLFDDPGKTSGRLYWELGLVQQILPVSIANSSLFNHLLFKPLKNIEPIMKKCPDSLLMKCVETFQSLKESASSISGRDADLLQAEMTNAINMSLLGIKRYLQYSGTRQTGLKNLKNQVIRQHESLWLARNRPGGLEESLAYLQKLI